MYPRYLYRIYILQYIKTAKMLWSMTCHAYQITRLMLDTEKDNGIWRGS